MNELEIAIWSAAAGAIGLVALACAVDALLTRTASAVQGALFNVVAFLFVVVQSGLATALIPSLTPSTLQRAQVLTGLLCMLLGDYWVRAWLGARHRDMLMDRVLLGGTFIAAAAGPVCLLLPPSQQLPTAAIIVLLNTGAVVWMGVRARLLGDALALGIAIGVAAMLGAIAGLYAIALRVPGVGIGWQSFIAFMTVLCMSIVGAMLWLRNGHQRRMHGFEPERSEIDPVTRLRAGAPFVRQLIRALERRRITRRDGALIAVMLFQPERIVTQAGAAALNEVYLQLARRLQHQVGVVNPVGRYWDRCFVALAESIHSPAALRTMGLRVATAMRRPMHVTAFDGSHMQVRAEIGIGVVHLQQENDPIEDLLHDAQDLAEIALGMASRAAMRDRHTREPVPVEHAQLGPRRHHRQHGRHVPVFGAARRARA